MTGAAVTAVVDAAQAGLLAYVLLKRRELLTLTLALAFLAALVVGNLRHGDELRPLLIAIDAGVVAAMGYLSRRFASRRAAVIAAVSLGSIALGIAGPVMGLEWNAQAAASNAGVFVQILVAGGLANGVIAWVGNRAAVVRRRLAGILHHDGGDTWGKA